LAQEHNLDRIALNQFDDKFTDLSKRLESSQDPRQIIDSNYTNDHESEKPTEEHDDHKKLLA